MVNTKSQKVICANSNICRKYRGKIGGRGPFALPHPEQGYNWVQKL